MKKYANKAGKSMLELLQRSFLPVLEDEMLAEERRINEILEVLAPYIRGDHSHDLAEKIRYRRQIFDQLISDNRAPDNFIFQETFGELISEWKILFDFYQDSLRVRQKAERFYSQPGNHLVLKFLKFWKRLAYKITVTPLKILNGFRRLLKKPEVPVEFWWHTVPLKKITSYHYGIAACLRIAVIYRDWKTKSINTFLKLKTMESAIFEENITDRKAFKNSSKELVESIKKQKKNVNDQIDQILKDLEPNFATSFHLVGTIERSPYRYSNRRLNSGWVKAEAQFSKIYNEWNNTLFALFEEWRTDTELDVLDFEVSHESNLLKKNLHSEYVDQLSPLLNQIESFIVESKEELKKTKNLNEYIVKQKYRAQKMLDQGVIPELSAKLISRNLPGLINRLEKNVTDKVQSISDKRVVVQTNSFQEPLSDKSLARVSIRELVSFEMLPKLSDSLTEVRKIMFNGIDEVSNVIHSLDQMVMFAFTSAQQSLSENEKEEDELRTVLEEGLNRVLERIVDLKSDFEKLFEKVDSEVKELNDNFISETNGLKDAENILTLRIRLARAKTLAQSDEVKSRFFDLIRYRFTTIRDGLRGRISKMKSRVQQYLNQYLFQKEVQISKETSDFLIYANQAIEELPLIYRKLFEIEPLNDFEMYEGRSSELEQLEKAYKSWKSGYLSATALTGEKWGGLTSFVNFSLNQIKFDDVVFRARISGSIQESADLVAFFNQLIENKNFKDLSEVEAFLIEGNKKVVIIEDIQNLYLRKIEGFQLLNVLSRLMSKTNRQVFWICTCTLYAWRYLNSVVQIHDFFHVKIELEDFSDTEIVNIITKRNRISGYKIEFDETNWLEDKNFRKLQQEQRQTFLKDQFFRNLTNYAKSNVSLALIYWLLSIKSVDSSTITIGSFTTPDLTFLRGLSMSKIHILQALILHDGLGVSELKAVLDEDDTIVNKLDFLLEDGILIKRMVREVDHYFVAPLVYRAVITLLNDRNMISY